VVPFSLVANANTRTAISPVVSFTGPAVVLGIHFTKGGTPKGTQGIILGKAQVAVSEINVSNGTVRPWTALFEPTLNAGTGSADTLGSDQGIDLQASMISNDANLGIIIPDTRFFLVIAVVALGTGGDAFEGHVSLLEQVAPAALANFL
jgi:hypothetical protein